MAEYFFHYRASWDENVLRSEVMVELGNGVQVQRVLLNALPPQPARECRLLRGGQVFKKATEGSDSTPASQYVDADIAAVAVVSTSVSHGIVMPEAPQELLPSAHVFKENLFVERIGNQHQTRVFSTSSASSPAGGCKVTLISEVDIKYVN